MRLKILIVTCLLLFSSGCTQRQTTELCLRAPKDSADAICIQVEIADTPDAREKGLSYRNSLKQDRGMLFVFSKEGKYGFWMKEMRFPLDIIWIDRNKTIIFIEENLPPCKTSRCPSYGPDTNSLYVLETNANFARENNITEGTRVYFEFS